MRFFFLPSERPLPNDDVCINALKAVNREHGKDKDIVKSIRHSRQTKNPMKRRIISKRIHLLSFLASSHSYIAEVVKGVTASYHYTQILKKMSLTWSKINLYKLITQMRFFSFTFCMSRPGKEENFAVCNYFFILLKWHYYISLGHSLIFGYVYEALDSDPQQNY